MKAIHLCESCDAPLKTKRRCCDERCYQIEFCKGMGTQAYRNGYVAPEFQAMIRAEAAATATGYTLAVVSGIVKPVGRFIGQCACITCGIVLPWTGGANMVRMNAGHFIGRSIPVMFEEPGCNPQCSTCNKDRGGMPQEYRLWMEAVHGIQVIERLENLKRQSVSFSRDELVDKRLEFSRRLKAAELKMKGTT